MAFASERGDEIEPLKPMSVSDDEAMRFRDLAIVRLRKKKLSWRRIGKCLNMAPSHAIYRYRKIPIEERERHERQPMLG